MFLTGFAVFLGLVLVFVKLPRSTLLRLLRYDLAIDLFVTLRTPMQRDDFSRQTLDTLAKRVGVRCSNPNCGKPTAGPKTTPTESVNIGVGAHISAAAPGGPRFDAGLTSEQRQSIDNAIWLCQNCAKLVDNDPGRYTIAALREWKTNAEAAARAQVEGEVRKTLGVHGA
jgi:hypothetical protein